MSRQRTTLCSAGSGPSRTQSATSLSCAAVNFRRAPRCGRLNRPAKPSRIVAVHPIPQRLPVHTSRTRRLAPTLSLQHQRQRQHPPRCRCIPCALPRSQIRSRQLRPRDLTVIAVLLHLATTHESCQPSRSNSHLSQRTGRWYKPPGKFSIGCRLMPDRPAAGGDQLSRSACNGPRRFTNSCCLR